MNVDDLINTHLAVTYTELAEYAEDLYSVDMPLLTTQADVLAYALPVDFMRVSNVFAVQEEGQTPVVELEDWATARYRAPRGAHQINLEYFPNPPTWTNDNDRFDGIAGFEELICIRVARDLRFREKNDISQVIALEQAERQRIMSKAKRKVGGPRYMRDVDDSVGQFPWSMVSNPIRGWRVRRNQIELYEGILPLPVT